MGIESSTSHEAMDKPFVLAQGKIQEAPKQDETITNDESSEFFSLPEIPKNIMQALGKLGWSIHKITTKESGKNEDGTTRTNEEISYELYDEQGNKKETIPYLDADYFKKSLTYHVGEQIQEKYKLENCRIVNRDNEDNVFYINNKRIRVGNNKQTKEYNPVSDGYITLVNEHFEDLKANIQHNNSEAFSTKIRLDTLIYRKNVDDTKLSLAISQALNIGLQNGELIDLGSIDGYILRNNGEYYIFFSDIHVGSNYYSGNGEFITKNAFTDQKNAKKLKVVSADKFKNLNGKETFPMWQKIDFSN